MKSITVDEGPSDKGVIWNVESVLGRVGGRTDRLQQLLDLFVKDMPKRLEDLERQVENADLESSMQILHTIKGVAGNLGAQKLRYLSAELELTCRDGSLHEVHSRLDEFNSTYEELLIEIKAFESELN